MKTDNFETIEANTSHELRTKITKDRVKLLKKPNTDQMFSVSAPYLRATFYTTTLERAKKRAKILASENMGIVVTITAPK